MTPEDLESLVARKLEQLPAPQAPPSLLPRILAAARAPDRVRSGWPRLAQSAALAALVVLAVWLGRGPADAPIGVAQTLAEAVTMLWQAFVEPNAAPLAALIGSLAAISALACAALWHLFQERSIP